MNWKLTMVLLTLAVFSAYSLVAMMQVGYLGIWLAGLSGWGEGQVLMDLVVACGLIMVWMVADAKKHGLNPWPFVLVTVTAGSFGPLLYLVWRLSRKPVADLTT
jgi:hypothetical protein